MKKIITLFVLLTTTLLFSQKSGINYQAVIYNPSDEILPGNNNANSILANKNICIRFSIKDANNALEYQEIQKITTDGFGMVNTTVGKGTQISGFATSFDAILWNSNTKKLVVDIDTTANCKDFLEVSNQDFSAVPFAFAAQTAEKVSGIVPVENGGTGASTVSGAKINLGLNNVDNTSDLNKPISNATKTALDLKENTANKSTNTALGTSDILFPTQNAVKVYVDTNLVANSTPDATTSAKGKLKLAGDLGGTADLPTVPGLATKENTIVAGTSTQYFRGDKTWQTLDKASVGLSNVDNTADSEKPVSSAIQTALDSKAPLTSPSLTGIPLAPTPSTGNNSAQIATTAFVNTAISNAATQDATTSTKGKIQLAGDLAGTASSAAAPVISNNAITTVKINNNAVTNDKLAPSSVKNTNIGEPISVTNGGSGTNMSTTSGYIKQASSGANFTTVTSIPVNDVAGAVKSVNGVFPDLTGGNVSVILGKVTTGNNSTPTVAGTPVNSDIYVVSGQTGTPNDNGRTYIYDGTNWNEVATNIASTDNRYVKLTGSNMSGNLNFPTGNKITIADAPAASTDVTNKSYVDTLVANSTTDATTTAKGKLKLAGDLGGTADAPTVPGLATKENIIASGTATQYFRGDKTWQTLDKASVGLSNVDNTADADKPVSTAIQTALNSKAPITSPSLTGTPLAPTPTAGTNSTQIATTAFVNTAISNAATPDATTSIKGKIKLAGDLGGTADLPTVPGLATKENTIATGTTTQYFRGDKTWQTLDKASVGLSNVDNTADADKPVSTAIQSALNTKAPIASPSLTGTPLAPTATAGTNSTQIATTAFVYTAVANATTPDATTLTKGKIKLAGDLGGTADLPTVPGLTTKENTIAAGTATQYFRGDKTWQTLDKASVGLSNVDNTADADKPVSTAIQTALNSKAPIASPSLTGTPLAPTATAGTNSTQIATTAFVNTAITNAATPDATNTLKGKIQLAGDLGGTGSSAAAPIISDNAITTVKINNNAVTNDKLALSSVKNTNIGEVISVANGGSGTNMSTTSGYIKQASSGANFTTVTSIPVNDVAGAVKSVNGVLPDISNGNVTVVLGKVTTGINSTPTVTGTPVNSDIYVVSGQTGTPNDNGRTYIYDGTKWNEVATNISTTDSRYVKLTGSNMSGNLNFPTGNKVTIADAPAASTDVANKAYVDSLVSTSTIDATTSAKGKIKLAGDLGGTADSPTVPGLATKENTIAAGTTTQYFRGDKTWQTLDKASVGLSNVDNTSDANKPVSAAIQTALDLKAPIASPSLTGTPLAPTATAGTNSTQIATTAFVTSAISSATIPDATTSAKGKIKLAGDLGGTADSPTVPGLVNKENTIAAGTTTQYFRGDKTWQTLDKASVGLSNVDNTADADKPVSSAIQTALDLKAPIASPSLTGTPLAPTAIAGTNSTQIATTAFVYTAVANATIPDATTSTKGKIKLAGDLGGTADLPTVPGLANKENTIAAGTTTQYFRGDKTWQTLNKASVGLSNVDNTADADKPVSAAIQTALDLKAPIASPSLTGTPLAPTATAGTNNTQIATTAFVNTAISGKQDALTLTTTGSGAATLTGSTLNIPNNSGGTVSNVSALTIGTSGTDIASTVANSTSTPTITLNVPTASASNRGALSTADWTTFNGKIGGSGTASYLPKFSSTNQLANSIIFDSGTNVGINTASPTFRLHILGNARIQPNTSNTGTGNDSLWMEFYGKLSTGTGSQVGGLKFGWYNTFGSIEVVRPGSSTGAGLAFNYADDTAGATTEMMRITPKGNIGIGTTSPSTSALLDINVDNLTTKKGLLLPKVALTSNTDQTTIASPAKGLIVYNLGTAGLSIEGFVFWNGSEWRKLNNTSTATPSISSIDCDNAKLSPSTYTSGTAYSGTLTVPYFDGNGASYNISSILTSTGVTGLTATLQSGDLANGYGYLVYKVTGTPNMSSPNNAIFTVPTILGGTGCSLSVGTGLTLKIGESISKSYEWPTSATNGTLLSSLSTAVAASLPKVEGLQMDVYKSDATFYGPRIYNTSSSTQIVSYQTFATHTNENKTAVNQSLLSNGYVSVDNNDICYWTTSAAEIVTTNLQIRIGSTAPYIYHWYEFKWWAMEMGTSKVIFMSVTRNL